MGCRFLQSADMRHRRFTRSPRLAAWSWCYTLTNNTYLHDRLTGLTKLYCMWHSALSCTKHVSCQYKLGMLASKQHATAQSKYLHIRGTILVAATSIIPKAMIRTNRICISRPEPDSACDKTEVQRGICTTNRIATGRLAYVQVCQPSLQMYELHFSARKL